MANRYPLVANASTLVMEEIASTDTLILENLNVTTTANLGAVGNVTITGGTTGQLLSTNGSGVLTWTSDTSPPAGGNTQVQYNNNGTIGANSTFTFNTTNNVLSAPNVSASSTVTATGNVTGGNLVTSGIIQATGNINGGNGVFTLGTVVSTSASMSANVTANNITANTYVNILGGGLFYSDNGKYIGLTSQDGIAANYVFGLPSADGTANSFISTDGAGALSFKQPASSSAPSTASSTGIAGQIAFDSDYIYVCTATNTWKRAAIATWP